MEYEALKKEIEMLKKRLDDLESVNNLPIQVDKTFQGRGFLNSTVLESLDPLD